MEVEESEEDEEMSANGFPLFLKVPLNSSVRVTEYSVVSEQWMGIRQEAVKVLKGPMQECVLKKIFVKIVKVVECE